MKAISIWNPFAILIVRGHKRFETRTWPAPQSIIGQRIAIAATKMIRPEQKAHFNDPEFQSYYSRLGGMPETIQEMPNGFVLGTVVVTNNLLITEEVIAEEVSYQERSFGWWNEGYYGWELSNPIEFDEPIPVRGAQGIYEWKSGADEEKCEDGNSNGAANSRGHLRVIQ